MKIQNIDKWSDYSRSSNHSEIRDLTFDDHMDYKLIPNDYYMKNNLDP